VPREEAEEGESPATPAITIRDSSEVTGEANATGGQGAAVSVEPAGFAISQDAARAVAKKIRRRVLWHRGVAVALVLAALCAIGVGVLLIFLAGDIAKNQRVSDVTAISQAKDFLSIYQDQLKKDKQLLTAAKTADDRDTTNADIDTDNQRIAAAQDNINRGTEKTKAINDRREAGIKPLDEERQKLDEELAAGGNGIQYNSILIRIAAVLLVVFLVQTFISVFRYITRLAAYYQGRVDSLELSDGSSALTISNLKELAAALSPESYDFGKPPKGPTEQAIEIAKVIVSNTRSKE